MLSLCSACAGQVIGHSSVCFQEVPRKCSAITQRLNRNNSARAQKLFNELSLNTLQILYKCYAIIIKALNCSTNPKKTQSTILFSKLMSPPIHSYFLLLWFLCECKHAISDSVKTYIKSLLSFDNISLNCKFFQSQGTSRVQIQL